MAASSDAFKAALGRFCSGVTVIALRDADGNDHAMTASAFSSLSLDPPLVLVCVKKGGAMHDAMSTASGFSVNLLDATQESVSNRFAGWWEDGLSKWADLGLRRAPVSGGPWIDGALAWLDCTPHGALDGGDHTIFVGLVEGAEVSDTPRESLSPLLYFAGRYAKLGD